MNILFTRSFATNDFLGQNNILHAGCESEVFRDTILWQDLHPRYLLNRDIASSSDELAATMLLEDNRHVAVVSLFAPSYYSYCCSNYWVNNLISPRYPVMVNGERSSRIMKDLNSTRCSVSYIICLHLHVLLLFWYIFLLMI